MTLEIAEPFGPVYPNLPSVAKFRNGKTETPEQAKAYGRAVRAAINALNRSALKRANGPVNPRSPCASGTWHAEGAAIRAAVREQHSAALQAQARADRARRSDNDIIAQYGAAMAAKWKAAEKPKKKKARR